MDRPVRILVVDDDAPTRRLLAAALSSENLYEVVTARSAMEACAIFSNSPGFDLIMSDLTMPVVSGLDLIEKIRKQDIQVPILILSSMHTDQSLAKALEAGADDYLQKPVDLRELRRAVAFLIDQRQKKQELRPEQMYASHTPLESIEPRPGNTAVVRNIENGTFVELVALNDSRQADRFQRFAERLVSTSLSEKERGELRLALEEIVRNAIEWGNHNDASKTLRLSYCLLPDRITFRIEDQGEGFDPEVLKDPSKNPRAHIAERRACGKRMGGWGIFLTRKLMDEVTFNAKGNVVFLTKYLPRHEPKVPVSATTAPTSDVVGIPSNPENSTPSAPARRNTRMLRKTTRLLRKEDPRFKEA